VYLRFVAKPSGAVADRSIRHHRPYLRPLRGSRLSLSGYETQDAKNASSPCFQRGKSQKESDTIEEKGEVSKNPKRISHMM